MLISHVQALEVIRELQKHFPIKRAPMRLRFMVPPGPNFTSLLEKLDTWNAVIVSKDESGTQFSAVSLLILLTLVFLIIADVNHHLCFRTVKLLVKIYYFYYL